MRKNHYETTVILKPESGTESLKQFAEKINTIVNDFNGTIIDMYSWGEKKLSYEIKKNLKGHYVFFNHVSEGSTVAELERNFNIMEHVLKYMTIK
jgi:small subunit ribosomal protein S6